MLMTSGVKFGFARTLPHLTGVVLGFTAMVALIGLGLAAAFARLPQLMPVMRVVGALYMLWLALKIALAGPIKAAAGGGQPLGFLAGAAFQWVNPKGWVAALSALAAYDAVTDDYVASVVMIVGVFGLVAVPSTLAWTLFGASLSRWLADARAARAFNLVMAAVLVASIAPMMFE
jgi:threonine/homoserine/homoserine lactone efflux protein